MYEYSLMSRSVIWKFGFDLVQAYSRSIEACNIWKTFGTLLSAVDNFIKHTAATTHKSSAGCLSVGRRASVMALFSLIAFLYDCSVACASFVKQLLQCSIHCSEHTVHISLLPGLKPELDLRSYSGTEFVRRYTSLCVLISFVILLVVVTLKKCQQKFRYRVSQNSTEMRNSHPDSAVLE